MAAGTALLCCTLLFVLVFVSAGQREITAKSGQDVTLTCRAPNKKIRGVKWSRNHLEPENIFLYQDGLSDSTHQHPYFKNRVNLRDRQMKDGDVSLILKDVTINDAGTYMCSVFTEGADLLTLISVIDLSVDPADEKTIRAEFRQKSVTLSCRAPNNNKITAVKWITANLKSVLLYEDGHFDPANQHPSFKNRVNLRDKQMKDGDASLILKDVITGDTGRYVCAGFMEETSSWKFISSINLRVSPDQKNITAESGQDVTLTCRARNSNIFAVEWNRDDLKTGNVLFQFMGDIILDDQHPSFKNRVDLRDKQMKDGDVSLILKDVTIKDAGTYDCGVSIQEAHIWDHSIIHLHVVPPGQTGGDRDEL
ncbi:uncharacterized protein LOC120743231 [Simochromis diagramma]|uniref:uncharacterized protein LOC120743231 n=1 Tax=Simochromis diagramma TaxID=43689 RepID=UPI001A7E8ABA|nr:uncharacterized protein LOC120743231 [Simochromis diagramma]